MNNNDAHINLIDTGSNQPAALLQVTTPPDGYYEDQHDRAFIVQTKNPGTERLKEIFTRAHDDLAAKMPEEDALLRKGAVVSMVAVEENGRLTTANLGDSRVSIFVYNPDHKSVRGFTLTKDHKPQDPQEQARIEAAGGIVNYDGYMSLSTGRTATSVSRGFGATKLNQIMGRAADSHSYDLTQPPFLVKPDETVWVCVESDGMHCDMDVNERARELQKAVREWLEEQRKKKADSVDPNAETGEFAALDDSTAMFAPTPLAVTKPEPPETEWVARFMKDLAIAHGTRDNMTIAVSAVNLAGKTGDHIMAVIDGSGKDGYQVSETVSSFLQRELTA